MSSIQDSKIGYVKDRCVNAYWMLRRGELGTIAKSAGVELSHRLAQMRGSVHHQGVIFFRTIRISLQNGRQSVTALAHRGTGDDGIEHVHAIAAEVVPDSAFINRRKVLPASYQPTLSRMHIVDNLKTDSQQLIAQLADIRETVRPVNV